MGTLREKRLVNPQLRRQWLRRFEDDGESVSRIAEADSYDIRTVRKHIRLARQERELREATTMVLRGALERHYEDLCTFATKIESHLFWPPSHLSSLMQDRMWQGLREHLPRTVIWKATKRREQLVNEYDICMKEIRNQARPTFEARGLKFAQIPDEHGLSEKNLQDILMREAESIVRGGKRLKEFVKVSSKMVTDSGLYNVRVGAFSLGLWYAHEIDNLETNFWQILDGMMNWESTGKLEKIVLELQHQTKVLQDELATIRLKRVLPGRCRYCPL